MISYRRESDELSYIEEKVSYCIRFGHSLWSASQLPAQEVSKPYVSACLQSLISSTLFHLPSGSVKSSFVKSLMVNMLAILCNSIIGVFIEYYSQ